jgi:hypothetical protein
LLQNQHPSGIGLFSLSTEARYAAEQDIAVGNISPDLLLNQY